MRQTAVRVAAQGQVRAAKVRARQAARRVVQAKRVELHRLAERKATGPALDRLRQLYRELEVRGPTAAEARVRAAGPLAAIREATYSLLSQMAKLKPF